MTLGAVSEAYLTRKEVCQELRVSVKTVQRWEREGLPVEVWGSRLRRYRLDRVRGWLDQRSRRSR